MHTFAPRSPIRQRLKSTLVDIKLPSAKNRRLMNKILHPAHLTPPAQSPAQGLPTTLLNEKIVQASLKVAPQSDAYEQEADLIADQVIKTSDADLNNKTRQPTNTLTNNIQNLSRKHSQRLSQDISQNHSKKKSQASTWESMPLPQKNQTGIETSAPAQLESSLDDLKNSGTAIPTQSRHFFEPRFAHDFSNVKIHTGANAEQLTEAFNARAFTFANNIVFGAGEFQPNSDAGKHLFGHELTHVIQQNNAVPGTLQRVTKPGSSSAFHEDYQPTRLVNIEELFSYSDINGWSRSLPIFTGKLSKNKGKKASGSKARIAPSVSVTKGGAEEVRLDNRVVTEQTRQDFENRLNLNRQEFKIPTSSGQFNMYRSTGGYAFRSASNAAFEQDGKYPNEEFTTWLKSQTIDDVIDKPTKAQKNAWKRFKKVAVGEGDTAAVNAWDKQTLTLGAGFTGARMVRVLNAMPALYHEKLYQAGIALNDGTLLIYDPDIHAVTRGKNAYRVAAVTPQILATFIQLAQSTQTATQNGETGELRLWMVKAQFEEFQRRTKGCTKIGTWDKQTQKTALRLMHWLGAVSCKSIEKTNGDPQKMADVGARVISKHWESAGFASEQAGLDRLKRIFSNRGFTITVKAPGKS